MKSRPTSRLVPPPPEVDARLRPFGGAEGRVPHSECSGRGGPGHGVRGVRRFSPPVCSFTMRWFGQVLDVVVQGGGLYISTGRSFQTGRVKVKP